MITLNGQVYRAVLDLASERIVIVRRGRQWRVASARDTVRVLAGLYGPALKLV